jgi:thioester reductase-like protein
MAAVEIPVMESKTDVDQLFGRVIEWSRRNPEKLLYSFLNDRGVELERHTYGSFLHRTRLLAGHLRRRPDLKPGDRVLLIYPAGLEMVCALFGCVAAGLVPVPTPAPSANPTIASLLRLDGIAADCRPTLILTTQAGLGWLHHAQTRRTAGVGTASSLTELPSIATDTLERFRVDDEPLTPSDIFLLQYTSGSTSRPKGVMVSVANILANCDGVVDHAAPIAVSWLPQHHDMGLLGYYVYILLSGGTTYGFAPATFVQRPALWMQTISRYRGTASSAPNFAFDLCLRQTKVPDSSLDGVDLSSLCFLTAAAEPIDPDVFRRFLHRFERWGLRRKGFFASYGLAESTLAVSNYGRRALSVDRNQLAKGNVRLTDAVSLIDDATHLMSSGRSLGDNRVIIVAPDTLRHCAASEIGEIWVTGNSKCLGYWGDPQATEEVFRARPVDPGADDRTYLRTGDMGFLLEGELYVCGRYKDMLIVRGKNYFPQDIEIIVQQSNPAVRPGCVAAFDTQNPNGPEIVVIVGIGTRVRPDGHAIAIAIRAALNLEIDCITFVPAREMPKTTSGKLMRYEARRKWRQGEFTVIGEVRRQSGVDHEQASSIDDQSFLGEFMRSYRLDGNETLSLTDIGVNSLDLVALLHHIAQRVAARSGVGETGPLDLNVLQTLSVAELCRLVQKIEQLPAGTEALLSEVLASANVKQHADDLSMMRLDSGFSCPEIRASLKTAGPIRNVLLSGGTGFLGPFLLRSLLQQSDAVIHVLTRGANADDALRRLRNSFTPMVSSELIGAFDARVRAVPADLGVDGLALDSSSWGRLAEGIDAIYHNAATVNYLFNYRAMRGVNVKGTAEMLRLACDGKPKEFNHISTTFIFGWARGEILYESDRNDEMQRLDFGYSQSKWAAEQRVYIAAKAGLAVRVFRPALVTPSLTGGGDSVDITIRLLSFMIKHGIGLSAANQVSFMPVDVTADNIVAISGSPATLGGTFHVTRDDYSNMRHVTDIITASTSRQFELLSLSDFVPEVIRRCRREDPLFPLLDFLVGSVSNISAMEFKRYDNTAYRRARDLCPLGRPDPSLHDTVNGMLRFMRRKGLSDV